MPYVIGVTGNIASGKSTVARMLQELGAEVIDADQVAHRVMAPPGPVFESLVREFGSSIVAPNGSIDRRNLGQIVFSDPAALRRLDALVHPHTSEEIHHLINTSTSKVVVVEAIKLIEAGTYRYCDSVWIVTSRPDQQVERLVMSRGLSVEDAERRVKAQGSIAAKLQLANVVVDASATLADTRRQVVDAWERLIRPPPPIHQ